MELHSTIGLGHTLNLILLLDCIAVNKQLDASKQYIFVLLQAFN
jgi:hypothetical protein